MDIDICLVSGISTWSSKKQPTMALSSTKAKYREVAIAACEHTWLLLILDDLEVCIAGSVVIFCHNMSGTILAKNLVYHERTKHIKGQ